MTFLSHRFIFHASEMPETFYTEQESATDSTEVPKQAIVSELQSLNEDVESFDFSHWTVQILPNANPETATSLPSYAKPDVLYKELIAVDKHISHIPFDLFKEVYTDYAQAVQLSQIPYKSSVRFIVPTPKGYQLFLVSFDEKTVEYENNVIKVQIKTKDDHSK